jgi:hypothetical protein
MLEAAGGGGLVDQLDTTKIDPVLGDVTLMAERVRAGRSR